MSAELRDRASRLAPGQRIYVRTRGQSRLVGPYTVRSVDRDGLYLLCFRGGRMSGHTLMLASDGLDRIQLASMTPPSDQASAGAP